MKNSGIEWIGKIPDDWKVERLQWYIEEVKVSNNPMQTDRVLSLTNKAGVIPYEEKGAQGNVAKEDYTQYKLAYPNTIVANSMNILIGSVGICNYFGCVSPVYYVFKPTKKADLLFINYIMQTIPFQKELRRYANGILEIRLRVSANGILKRKIAIPSLEKQKNIVDGINKKCAAVDRLIENQQAQIEKLKEYKQSVITEAVTRGIDPSVPMKASGVEWIGKIPVGWAVSRVGQLYTIILGKMLCPNKVSDDYSLEKYYCAANVHFDGISHNDQLKEMWFSSSEKEIYKVYESDLLVVEGGAGAGGCAVVKNISDDIYVQNSVMIVRSKKYGNILYLRYHIESLVKRGYIDIVCNKATIPHFTKDKLGNMPCVVPPLEEQQQIADYLDKKCAKIDKLIAVKQQKIEILTEYKKSLIYEYVTGKKQVG